MHFGVLVSDLFRVYPHELTPLLGRHRNGACARIYINARSRHKRVHFLTPPYLLGCCHIREQFRTLA